MKNRNFGILKFSTFYNHFLKRNYEGWIKSEKDYEEIIVNTLLYGDVYYLVDKAGRETLVFFHTTARWVVMVRDAKVISTAFVLYDSFDTIKDYLSKKGVFAYINMSDETGNGTYSTVVERIRSSLEVL